MRIVWTEAAHGDINAAWDYIAGDNVDAAEALCGRIVDAVEGLLIHPGVGRPGRLAGTRELVISGTPYLVVYAVDGTTIAILRVLHGARKFPPASLSGNRR
jgi:toxin ParE1/3/4